MTRGSRPALVLMAVASLFAGCARYTLVEPRPRTIADVYTVDPQTHWSSVTDGKWEVWTVDGPGLEAIQFLTGLPDGEPLFRAADAQKRMTFRTTMSPSELAELLVTPVEVAERRQVLRREVVPAGLQPEELHRLPQRPRRGLEGLLACPSD